MEGLIPPWQPGQVQVVVSRDPRTVIPALQQQLLNGESRRLMLQLWEGLPRHGEILDEVLRQLAAVARALWPAWYEAPPADAGPRTTPFGEFLARAEELSRLQHRIPRLSAPWLKQAAPLAAAGSLPVIHGFSRTVQCEQLALALGLMDGVVLLGVPPELARHRSGLSVQPRLGTITRREVQASTERRSRGRKSLVSAHEFRRPYEPSKGQDEESTRRLRSVCDESCGRYPSLIVRRC